MTFFPTDAIHFSTMDSSFICVISPSSDGILGDAIVRASRSNIYISSLRFHHDIMRDTTAGSSRYNIDDILIDTIVGLSR